MQSFRIYGQAFAYIFIMLWIHLIYGLRIYTSTDTRFKSIIGNKLLATFLSAITALYTYITCACNTHSRTKSFPMVKIFTTVVTIGCKNKWNSCKGSLLGKYTYFNTKQYAKSTLDYGSNLHGNAYWKGLLIWLGVLFQPRLHLVVLPI